MYICTYTKCRRLVIFMKYGQRKPVQSAQYQFTVATKPCLSYSCRIWWYTIARGAPWPQVSQRAWGYYCFFIVRFIHSRQSHSRHGRLLWFPSWHFIPYIMASDHKLLFFFQYGACRPAWHRVLLTNMTHMFIYPPKITEKHIKWNSSGVHSTVLFLCYHFVINLQL